MHDALDDLRLDDGDFDDADVLVGVRLGDEGIDLEDQGLVFHVVIIEEISHQGHQFLLNAVRVALKGVGLSEQLGLALPILLPFRPSGEGAQSHSQPEGTESRRVSALVANLMHTGPSEILVGRYTRAGRVRAPPASRCQITSDRCGTC